MTLLALGLDQPYALLVERASCNFPFAPAGAKIGSSSQVTVVRQFGSCETILDHVHPVGVFIQPLKKLNSYHIDFQIIFSHYGEFHK